jgi:hypothetical protein
VRVGVKFCGNCNPVVDFPELIRRLSGEISEIEFVHWNDSSGYSMLLVLNSCPVSCATRPDFKGTSIIVTSESVNCWPVKREEMTAAILQGIQKEAHRKVN